MGWINHLFLQVLSEVNSLSGLWPPQPPLQPTWWQTFCSSFDLLHLNNKFKKSWITFSPVVHAELKLIRLFQRKFFKRTSKDWNIRSGRAAKIVSVLIDFIAGAFCSSELKPSAFFAPFSGIYFTYNMRKCLNISEMMCEEQVIVFK